MWHSWYSSLKTTLFGIVTGWERAWASRYIGPRSLGGLQITLAASSACTSFDRDIACSVGTITLKYHSFVHCHKQAYCHGDVELTVYGLLILCLRTSSLPFCWNVEFSCVVQYWPVGAVCFSNVFPILPTMLCRLMRQNIRGDKLRLLFVVDCELWHGWWSSVLSRHSAQWLIQSCEGSHRNRTSVCIRHLLEEIFVYSVEFIVTRTWLPVSKPVIFYIVHTHVKRSWSREFSCMVRLHLWMDRTLLWARC